MFFPIHLFRTAICVAALTLLAACETTQPPQPEKTAPPARGGYYQDDGPASTTTNPETIPEAVPKAEPMHRFANRPYTILGRTYVPATALAPYKARGIASWYGKKFHGRKTSTGEIYDMFAMTAAHPTLPLPSYARVTHLASGKSIVVRVNDRGPFLHDRIIDLSFAAAQRIGIATAGTGEVEVETLLPGTPVAPGTLTKTAPPPQPAPPPDSAIQTIGSGIIVQLGVFTNHANADAFLAHIQDRLDTTHYNARIQQRDDGKFRVFLGPWPHRAEAQHVANHLSDALGLPVYITAP